MHPFKEAPPMLKRLRHRLTRKSDNLVLESCPLHTERPEWAAQAPAQVDAACKRGADVIGFTEVHSHLAHELAGVCARNGYGFFHDQGDTALAWKMTLDVTEQGNRPPVGFLFPAFVSFDFHGSPVTVYACHWEANHSDRKGINRARQTAALVADMTAASQGKRLSFYLADSNPHKPVNDPASEPRASLDKAGLPLVWVELGTYPQGVGVTAIGRNVADSRVKAVKAVLSPALGSDHQPGTATYSVKRPLHA